MQDAQEAGRVALTVPGVKDVNVDEIISMTLL